MWIKKIYIESLCKQIMILLQLFGKKYSFFWDYTATKKFFSRLYGEKYVFFWIYVKLQPKNVRTNFLFFQKLFLRFLDFFVCKFPLVVSTKFDCVKRLVSGFQFGLVITIWPRNEEVLSDFIIGPWAIPITKITTLVLFRAVFLYF